MGPMYNKTDKKLPVFRCIYIESAYIGKYIAHTLRYISIAYCMDRNAQTWKIIHTTIRYPTYLLFAYGWALSNNISTSIFTTSIMLSNFSCQIKKQTPSFGNEKHFWRTPWQFCCFFFLFLNDATRRNDD